MSSEEKVKSHLDPKTGKFVRGASTFRNSISKKPGAEFPAEKGRYHLYVSYACPWAHRALIVRKLKGLEDIIPFTSVHWHLNLDKSWRFVTKDESLPGENVRPDPVHPDYTYLHELYYAIDPDFSGRFTVPILYDTQTHQIVNNESSEIIRMMYTEFDDLLPEEYAAVDLLPQNLRAQIEETNEWTYNDINNGVYKCGVCSKQEAYEAAVHSLFAALDRAENHLATSPGPYYYGAKITEADVRLYVTIVRFDPVYVQHFKCNLRDIRSGYPALHRWLRKLYWNEAAFHSTTQFEHIKNHYTKSHLRLNPAGITALGPLPNILGLDEEVAAVAAARR